MSAAAIALIVILFVLLFLLSFVPQISTWLPSVLLPY